MVYPEPLEEVTADQVVAQKVLQKLRRYAKAVGGGQENTDFLNRLRSGIWNLVDPPDEGETEKETGPEADALLAVAERYSDTEEVDPNELLAAVRAALTDDHDHSKHLPDPVVGDVWDVKDPEREWLVDNWLPAGELALLSGPGNIGKSLLVLQLACALATSREVACWLPKGEKEEAEPPPLTNEGMPVVMANWEDSAPEARHRRFKLHAFGGCPWAEAPDVSEHLHVLPMRGHGPAWGPGGTGHISVMGELTRTGAALRGYCEIHEARLLVLDPVSLALAVEENSRPLVSVALESWAGWANDTGCAVLLTGHPSKVKEGEGNDYSGSTAWRGLVRSLWTLKPPKDDPDPNAAETCAELTLNKANYAKAGQVLNLRTYGRGAAWHFRSTDSSKQKGTGRGRKEVEPA